jgi:branched-subunit amino acid permease
MISTSPSTGKRRRCSAQATLEQGIAVVIALIVGGVFAVPRAAAVVMTRIGKRAAAAA